MAKGLTNRQHEILDFICKFIIERSFAPTVREIADEFGFSEKAAHEHVQALERKKYIAMQPLRPRSIKVLKMASVFYGSVGDLFLQVVPKGTAQLTQVRMPNLKFENVSICVGE